MGWREMRGLPTPPPRRDPDTPPSPADLRVGQVIQWMSPLFGLTTGVVKMLPADGHVIVERHEVLGDVRSVQVDWIVRIVKDGE